MHLIFYQHLYLETIPNREQTKSNMGRGIILIRKFTLKVIRKILTYQEIIDRIAEQTVLVTTQVNCAGDNSSVQRIKIVGSSELTAAKFFTSLFI